MSRTNITAAAAVLASVAVAACEGSPTEPDHLTRDEALRMVRTLTGFETESGGVDPLDEGEVQGAVTSERWPCEDGGYVTFSGLYEEDPYTFQIVATPEMCSYRDEDGETFTVTASSGSLGWGFTVTSTEEDGAEVFHLSEWGDLDWRSSGGRSGNCRVSVSGWFAEGEGGDTEGEITGTVCGFPVTIDDIDFGFYVYRPDVLI